MTDDNMSDANRQSALTGAKIVEAGRESYEQVKTKALDVVSRGTEAAKSQAMDQAETAKDALADTGERLAQSLRGALDGGDDSVQARLMASAADTVSEMAGSLRGRSFNQLMSDADAFARRNPGAFVAAAALAGFALARFARASAASPAPEPYDGSTRAGGSGYGASSGMGLGGSPAGFGATAGGGHHISTSSMSTHDDEEDDLMGRETTSDEDSRAAGGGLDRTAS